jgi:mono/diheme cytochrome c family protein
MRRGVWITLLFLCAWSEGASAAEEHLTDQQQLGRRLFEQSCAVCHTRPTLTAGTYGPELSKESSAGREEVIREDISNGTQRMPGFKYNFTPAQIDAIVAYLKTVPMSPPQPEPASPPQLPVVEDR